MFIVNSNVKNDNVMIKCKEKKLFFKLFNGWISEFVLIVSSKQNLKRNKIISL